MSNVVVNEVKKVGGDIKALFEKEKPVIENALKAALKAVEPVWKTALGGIIMKVVLDAAQVVAAGGTLKSIEAMVEDVLGAAKSAGVTAEGQSVTTLIGLAAQQIASEAATAGIAATPAAS